MCCFSFKHVLLRSDSILDWSGRSQNIVLGKGDNSSGVLLTGELAGLIFILPPTCYRSAYALNAGR